MQHLGCRRMSDYIAVLEKDRQSRRTCKTLLTVSISRFFRDRRLWEILEQELLPQLISYYPDRLAVWSAGCASGEEVYSFKIVWEQIKRQKESLPALYLLASDTNPETITRARVGVYPPSSLRELSTEQVARHFRSLQRKKARRIRSSLQRHIVWMQHDLLDRPPKAVFNIIFVRNSLLTYYRSGVQRAALDNITSRLSRPGLFIIGCRERWPPGSEPPAVHSSCRGVFWMQ